MRSGLRKIGLALSAVALLVTAVCLPLHYHANESAASDSAHCAVCHFAKDSRSASPSASFQVAPIADSGNPLAIVEERTFVFRNVRTVSSRAPPQA